MAPMSLTFFSILILFDTQFVNQNDGEAADSNYGIRINMIEMIFLLYIQCTEAEKEERNLSLCFADLNPKHA